MSIFQTVFVVWLTISLGSMMAHADNCESFSQSYSIEAKRATHDGYEIDPEEYADMIGTGRDCIAWSHEEEGNVIYQDQRDADRAEYEAQGAEERN